MNDFLGHGFKSQQARWLHIYSDLILPAVGYFRLDGTPHSTGDINRRDGIFVKILQSEILHVVCAAQVRSDARVCKLD